LLAHMVELGGDPHEIAKDKDLFQTSDTGELEVIIKKVLEDNASDAELVRRELVRAGLAFTVELAQDEQTFLQVRDEQVGESTGHQTTSPRASRQQAARWAKTPVKSRVSSERKADVPHRGPVTFDTCPRW